MGMYSIKFNNSKTIIKKMNELNIIIQIVQLAFSSGKIVNINEIKAITDALDKIEIIIKRSEIVNETTTRL